jgi:hypothetical protein
VKKIKYSFTSIGQTMKNIFQILLLILVLAVRTIIGQTDRGVFLFAANVSDEGVIHLNRETKNENISNKFSAERNTITTNWKTISPVKASGLSNSIGNYSLKVESAIINYSLPVDFPLYEQTHHYLPAAASAKDIAVDTALFKSENINNKDLQNNSKLYNLNSLKQDKNVAIDLFTRYGDNILAMVAGYFQGKGEGYRVTIEYGGPLLKVYSKNELSRRWHTFSVYRTSFQIGTAFTLFLSGRNDFWRSAIQSATCLSLNNLFSDGVYNNTKGFNWFRQSNDTGWGLEKTLTPGLKLGILSALVAIRIIYELWLKSD